MPAEVQEHIIQAAKLIYDYCRRTELEHGSVRLSSIIDYLQSLPEPSLFSEFVLFGRLDRCLSEMKYMIDNSAKFDVPAFQTLKHHIEDCELFVAYAKKKLEHIKSLPVTSDQRPRGY